MLWKIIKKIFSFDNTDNTKLSEAQSEQLLQNARAKKQNGQLDEAETLCQLILEYLPDHSYALHLSGLIAYQKGHIESACELIEKAIYIKPNEPLFFNSCGEIYWSLAKNEKAIEYLEKALELNPNYVEAQCNLGNIYFRLEQFDDAKKCYEHALSQKKDYVSAHVNLGSVLVKQQQFNDAIECFKSTLLLAPKFTEAHYNLGTARLELNQYNEAIKCFKNAILSDKNFAEAHLSLACTYILLDNFKEGWEEYEWRFESKSTYRKREFTQPYWDGTSLENLSILIWFEQGIGDEIMFANLLNSDIISKNANCLVECEPRLFKLFSRSFPDYKFFPRSYPADPRLTSDKIDYQIPIASLMRWKPNPEDLGKISPYLFADNTLAREFREKYTNKKNKLIVGISWKSGSAKHSSSRSVPIELWKDILLLSDIQFVNLQYGVTKEDIKKINEELSSSIYHDDSVDPLGDLDRFAAQASALDLVISVDNATVQITGALGVQTWTILPSSPDYRWGLNREYCLWYPNMYLFRQEVTGKWINEINSIQEKLIKFRDEHAS